MSNQVKIQNVEKSAIVQTDLFNYYGRTFHKYCWLDVSKNDHSSFVRYLEKIEATHILDTRSNPVFRRPKFSIQQLMTFFEHRKIEYNSISSIKTNKQQRVSLKNLAREANVVRMCCFFVFIFDSEEGTNSDRKRISAFLNKVESIRPYIGN